MRKAILAAAVCLAVAPAPAGAGTYGILSEKRITIPLQGKANPYPAKLRIVKLTGQVTEVTAVLFGVKGFVGDFEFLLVGPQGQAVMLMSDACNDDLFNSGIFHFGDTALSVMPSDTCGGDFYRPTNYNGGEPNEILPPPAPQTSTPTNQTLAVYEGAQANGTWSLFAFDDTPFQGGRLEGWGLEFRGVSTNRRCKGRRVGLLGTPGNDIIRGSDGRDVISGLGGNDRIRGYGKADRLCGDGGRDTIVGGKGRDRCDGGRGRDRVRKC